MRLIKLLALLATLTLAPAAAAQADDDAPWDHDERPGFNLNVVIRPVAGGPDDGFGFMKFRQPKDPAKIVYLDVRVRRLAPHHNYYLQRATDTDVNDDCTATNWLTLGHGSEPVAITTGDRGNGRAQLFRDLSAIPTGAQFDIHFRVIDAVSSAVALESGCYQYEVRGPVSGVHTLATFDPSKGEFPEGVAVDGRQHVYVGLALTGEIRRFDPQAGPRRSPPCPSAAASCSASRRTRPAACTPPWRHSIPPHTASGAWNVTARRSASRRYRRTASRMRSHSTRPATCT